MIISFCQQKGGCGKSTLAVHAVSWLAENGSRCALVDADPQQSALTWIKEACPAVDTFSHLIPDDILDRIPPLAGQYDHVVVDAPAAAQETARAVLLVSDLTILPCTSSAWDLASLADTARIVQQARRIRSGAPEAKVVLNRVQIRSLVGRELLDAVPTIGLEVCRTIIRQRPVIADTAGQRRPAWRMGPRGEEASKELKALFMEVFEHGRETAPERHLTLEGGGEGFHSSGEDRRQEGNHSIGPDREHEGNQA